MLPEWHKCIHVYKHESGNIHESWHFDKIHLIIMNLVHHQHHDLQHCLHVRPWLMMEQSCCSCSSSGSLQYLHQIGREHDPSGASAGGTGERRPSPRCRPWLSRLRWWPGRRRRAWRSPWRWKKDAGSWIVGTPPLEEVVAGWMMSTCCKLQMFSYKQSWHSFTYDPWWKECVQMICLWCGDAPLL